MILARQAGESFRFPCLFIATPLHTQICHHHLYNSLIIITMLHGRLDRLFSYALLFLQKRYLNSQEGILYLQKTWVWFPAPASGLSQPQVAPVPGDSEASGPSRVLASMCTQPKYKINNLIIIILCYFKWCLYLFNV